jgi:hypothetical protein
MTVPHDLTGPCHEGSLAPLSARPTKVTAHGGRRRKTQVLKPHAKQTGRTLSIHKLSLPRNTVTGSAAHRKTDVDET